MTPDEKRLIEVIEIIEARYPMIKRVGKGAFDESTYAQEDKILCMLDVNKDRRKIKIPLTLLNQPDEELVKLIINDLGLSG